MMLLLLAKCTSFQASLKVGTFVLSLLRQDIRLEIGNVPKNSGRVVTLPKRRTFDCFIFLDVLIIFTKKNLKAPKIEAVNARQCKRLSELRIQIFMQLSYRLVSATAHVSRCVDRCVCISVLSFGIFVCCRSAKHSKLFTRYLQSNCANFAVLFDADLVFCLNTSHINWIYYIAHSIAMSAFDIVEC